MRRWLRLDAQWDDTEWVMLLEPLGQLAWIKLLCYVKLAGKRGVAHALTPKAAAKKWGVTAQAVEDMIFQAVQDGALRREGDNWVVTKWAYYQEPDGTAAERKRRQRAQDQPDSPNVTPPSRRDTEESRRDPVARDHRPPTTNSNATTTAPALPAADVEKPEAPTGRADERPTYTRSELWEMADRLLGLGRLDNAQHAANGRILNGWLYASDKRDPVDIACAIEGAAALRDRDLIGWESAKPGAPMTLKALNGPMTLADQGDGKAVRNLYDVAVEYARKQDDAARTTPTARIKSNAMKRAAYPVPENVSGAA